MVVDYAQLLSTDFLDAQEVGSSSNDSTTQKRWSKPLQNCIKINVDGAFNPTVRKATIGVIARNDHVFEGDACNIVTKLARRELDRSLAAYHLYSVVNTLVDYPGFSFVSIRRNLNRTAHGLAQWALHDDVNFRFDFDIPYCIEHFVIEDAIFG
ncbi:hypothetical protein V6N11_018496 [Hibiscus sabdariffa]|uniref:RNase H type-1 domain-containing protein n=1 Tax=Hibiscus sabdariffa TaxID=183260 RepID=A0ABR2T7J8_9ROSI